jgi:hypothetical protein
MALKRPPPPVIPSATAISAMPVEGKLALTLQIRQCFTRGDMGGKHAWVIDCGTFRRDFACLGI